MLSMRSLGALRNGQRQKCARCVVLHRHGHLLLKSALDERLDIQRATECKRPACAGMAVAMHNAAMARSRDGGTKLALASHITVARRTRSPRKGQCVVPMLRVQVGEELPGAVGDPLDLGVVLSDLLGGVRLGKAADVEDLVVAWNNENEAITSMLER